MKKNGLSYIAEVSLNTSINIGKSKMAEKKKKGGMFSAAKKFLTTRHMDYVKKDQGFIKKAAKLAAEAKAMKELVKPRPKKKATKKKAK